MIVAHVVVLNGLYNAHIVWNCLELKVYYSKTEFYVLSSYTHILWTITKFLSIFKTLNNYKIWVVVDDMLPVLPPCEFINHICQVICIYI